MGFFDSLSGLLEAATPWSTVEAEAVQQGGARSEKTPADKDEGSEGEAEVCYCYFIAGSLALYKLLSSWSSLSSIREFGSRNNVDAFSSLCMECYTRTLLINHIGPICAYFRQV